MIETALAPDLEEMWRKELACGRCGSAATHQLRAHNLQCRSNHRQPLSCGQCVAWGLARSYDDVGLSGCICCHCDEYFDDAISFFNAWPL